MHFEKQVTVDAPRQNVWDFLWDVSRLVACIPGCETAEEVEPYQRYQATIIEKVGPFRVKVPLVIEVLENTAPERLVARANGKDTVLQSHVKMEIDLALIEMSPQVTQLQLTADVAVLGKLGTLGHSVMVRKGDEIVGQFATALRAELQEDAD